MYGVAAVLLAALILAFLSAFGIVTRHAVAKLFKCNNGFGGGAFATPIIGAAGIICVTQTLNVFMPVRAVAIILTVLLVVGIVLCRREAVGFVLELKGRPFILFIAFLSIVLTLIPCIRYNDLLCLHYANNDVAYYLSSMEWLRDNAFLDPISFSDTQPFNSLADYILKTTRIGTDIFGAFVLSLVPLEAHQIFLVLCAVFNVLCVFSAVNLMHDIFGMSNKLTCFGAAVIGTGCSLIELTKQQYAPQILGIAFFISFIACLLRFFGQDRSFSDAFWLGFTAVATISVYSEYASYAVILFIIAFAIRAVREKNKKSLLLNVSDSFKMLFIAFVSNIPGFLIALKFNFNVLFSQLGSLESIDPYGGNITDSQTFLRYVFNIDVSYVKAVLSGGFVRQALYFAAVIVFIIISVSFAIHAVSGAIRSIKSLETEFALAAILFFGLYLLFFRKTEFAYGEYKHIHLTLIPTFIMLLWFINNSFDKMVSEKLSVIDLKRIRNSVLNVTSKLVIASLVCFSLINAVRFSMESRSTYRFDSSLGELSRAVEENVPYGDTVGIINGWYFEAHSMVYALRNTDRSVSLLTPDSYFSMFTATHPTDPTYIITAKTESGSYSDILSLEDYTAVWQNERHCLLKNNTDVGVFADFGFSGLNSSDPQMPCRSVGASSGIVLWNNGEEDKTVVLNFKTEIFQDGALRKFKVCLGEEVLFSGASGDTVQISNINIPAKSRASISIEVDCELTENAMKIHSLDTDIIG